MWLVMVGELHRSFVKEADKLASHFANEHIPVFCGLSIPSYATGSASELGWQMRALAEPVAHESLV